uniref:Uncharacterized protein n=1 Tax=Rhabditophanes sp. KR3021 TaxID=114890 RepID=A0AC35U5K6_9BILA
MLASEQFWDFVGNHLILCYTIFSILGFAFFCLLIMIGMYACARYRNLQICPPSPVRLNFEDLESRQRKRKIGFFKRIFIGTFAKKGPNGMTTGCYKQYIDDTFKICGKILENNKLNKPKLSSQNDSKVPIPSPSNPQITEVHRNLRHPLLDTSQNISSIPRTKPRWSNFFTAPLFRVYFDAGSDDTDSVFEKDLTTVSFISASLSPLTHGSKFA